MKALHFINFTATLLVAGTLFIGCGHKEGDGHDQGKEAGHGEESPAGASFKAGKGVMLTDETRKILGVEVADVTERKVPDQIRFAVQMFGENHRHLQNQEDHSGCEAHGSGFLPASAAVKAGQTVQLLKDTNSPLGGVVLSVQKALTLGESEVVVAVPNATAMLKPGEFLQARITLPRDEAVTAIPQAALLRTCEGAFVYAVNGGAYFRTAVKVGAETNGWVEIADGLLAGDQVVTNGVAALWLVELRATKGGGGCTH